MLYVSSNNSIAYLCHSSIGWSNCASIDPFSYASIDRFWDLSQHTVSTSSQYLSVRVAYNGSNSNYLTIIYEPPNGGVTVLNATILHPHVTKYNNADTQFRNVTDMIYASDPDYPSLELVLSDFRLSAPFASDSGKSFNGARSMTMDPTQIGLFD